MVLLTKWLGATLLSLGAVLSTSANAGPTNTAGRVRLVEAVADAEVDREAVVKVIPVNAARGRQSVYPALESELADALRAAGLNVQQNAVEPDVYARFDYGAKSFDFYQQYGNVNDSAYRVIIVTAIAGKPWRESQTTKVLWRTVADQTGLSTDVKKVIPPLIKAATPWYGRNLTKVGIAAAASVCGPGAGDAGHIVGACTRAVVPPR